MKDTHTFPVRIYYEDTDAAGRVYHSNYLKYAERARTEALRLAGLELSEIMREQHIIFVIRRCVCDFLKPAMLDDLLTIETRLDDIGKVSMTMHQTVRRGHETLVTLEVKIAAIGAGMKPVKMPPAVYKAIVKMFNYHPTR